ncbi:MAG: hypothetical protein H5T62_15905 [Anaerolineae bacterium]|nr:hypothetical protein [Anaerolineae bacterium]
MMEAKAGQGCPAYVLPSPYQYYHSHHEYDSAYNNSPDCIVFDLLVGESTRILRLSSSPSTPTDVEEAIHHGVRV